MKNLENILIAYENDIKFWNSDFGEGHIVLENRELLKPYEDGERVKALDDKALKLIKDDKSKGSDALFLKKLKEIIEHASYRQAAA